MLPNLYLGEFMASTISYGQMILNGFCYSPERGHSFARDPDYYATDVFPKLPGDLTFEQARGQIERPLAERVVWVNWVRNEYVLADRETGSALIDNCIFCRYTLAARPQEAIASWAAQRQVCILTGVVGVVLLAGIVTSLVFFSTASPVVGGALAVARLFAGIYFGGLVGSSARGFRTSTSEIQKWNTVAAALPNFATPTQIAELRAAIFRAFLGDGDIGHLKNDNPYFRKSLKRSEFEALVRMQGLRANPDIGQEALGQLVQEKMQELGFKSGLDDPSNCAVQ